MAYKFCEKFNLYMCEKQNVNDLIRSEKACNFWNILIYAHPVWMKLALCSNPI